MEQINTEQSNKDLVYNLRQGSAVIIDKTLIRGVITKNVRDCVFLLISCKEHIGLCHIDRCNSVSSIEDFLKKFSNYEIKKITIAGGGAIENKKEEIEKVSQFSQKPDFKGWFLDPGNHNIKIVDEAISRLGFNKSNIEIKKLEQKGDFYYKCDVDILQNSNIIEIGTVIKKLTKHGDESTAYTLKERQKFQTEAQKTSIKMIDIIRSVPLSQETDLIVDLIKPDIKIKQPSVSKINSENNINQKKGFCNLL